MIAIISPAKTLDFETQNDFDHTLPKFHNKSVELIEVLKEKSEEEIQDLMSISDKLANLNVERYHNFTKKKNPQHAKQAIFAFQGDVYQGLEAESLSKTDIEFAQDHLRILSGLYGILKPLDLIQPYRLEMGTSLNINGNKNLYEFWGDSIAKALNSDLKNQTNQVIVNLASQEYFKAVDTKALKANVIDVEFKDHKNGEYKVIAFYAKKARGYMSRYIAKNKITDPEELKGFDYEGYWFDDKDSSENKLAFKRD